MRRSFPSVAALMAVLALAQFARGADDKGWVGQQVMLKRADVRPQVGKQPTGDPFPRCGMVSDHFTLPDRRSP